MFVEMQVFHPREEGPSLSAANTRGISISQQAGVLTVNILTPSAPFVVRLSVAILREGEHVLIVNARAFRGTATIEAVQGLEAEAVRSATPKTPATGGATARERESSGDVSVQWLTESLAELQRIADGEDEFGGQRDSVMGDLLTRGEAVAMEPDQEHTSRLEALERALDQAAKVNPWSQHLDKIWTSSTGCGHPFLRWRLR